MTGADHEPSADWLRVQRDLGLALSEDLGFQELLDRCLAAALEGSKLDAGGIYLVDPLDGGFDLIAHSGLSSEYLDRAIFFDRDSANAKRILEGRAIYAHSGEGHEDPMDLLRSTGLRAMAVVPVKRDGLVVACITLVTHTQDEIPERVRPGLEAIALQIGGAIAHKNAEEALRESERRYRTLFDNTGDAIFVVDLNAGILDANEEACRRLGYSREELRTMSIADICSPKYAALVEERLEELRKKSHAFFQSEHVSKDGALIPIETSVTRIIYGGELAFLSVARDISERRQLQEQLNQFRKMEAVGQLAGGIAHDFNNMLSPILGFSDLLLQRMTRRDPGYEDIRQIHDAANRAARVTQQLLAFSRRQVIEPRIIDLNEEIGKVEEMLRRLLGEDIRLVYELSPAPVYIHADPPQIQQVLVNLAINSRDAMPNGGGLTIETGDIWIGAQAALIQAKGGPGRYALLTASDEGCGMDEETISHIFEPFFTTKERGKGTGLGLASVYGIVTQHGGFIDVVSRPGRGTTFKVYLPSVDPPSRKRAPSAQSEPQTHGGKTVLVVEDEPSVRQLACRILARHGYEVLEAPGGGEALEIAASHEGPIHLLLTDVVMPGMNGKTLSDRIQAASPRTCVLFMSGYADHVVPETCEGQQEIHFLQKPFTIEKLLRKVREALESAAGAD